jgi:hypothetical protein
VGLQAFGKSPEEKVGDKYLAAANGEVRQREDQ